MKITCLGPDYSFSHIAAKSVYPDADFTFMSPFKMCRALVEGEVDIAVLPIENNIGGIVPASMNAIDRNSKITVFRQLFLPISQTLVCNGPLSEVREVRSHPQAFLQCTKNLAALRDELGISFAEGPSATTSAGIQSAAGDPTIAALGSTLAAEFYGVKVQRANFQDNKHNMTRFYCLQMGESPASTGNDRTTFIIRPKNEAGSLFKVLKLFADHDINILALTGRPTPSLATEWAYDFFLECKGHMNDENLAVIIKSLVKNKKIYETYLEKSGRCLGSFPDGDVIEP